MFASRAYLLALGCIGFAFFYFIHLQSINRRKSGTTNGAFFKNENNVNYSNKEGWFLKAHASASSNTPGLCENPNVVQESGYFQIANTPKQYFYWFFESRSSPSNDPLLIWLNGGPGCSSMLGLLTENGPCTVQSANVTKINPYSWNSFANTLFIDSPANTGFSHGGRNDVNENEVSRDLRIFLMEFLKKNPKFAKSRVYIFAESYGGHYAPAFAHAIVVGNKKSSVNDQINLKGMGIGNGLTDPLLQYPFYPEMAYNNERKSISLEAYKRMVGALPNCLAQIRSCYANGGPVCITALEYCNDALITPIQEAGWNVYDLRKKCGPYPLCYDFSPVEKFLNSHKKELNVPFNVNWEACRNSVHSALLGDWMHSYSSFVAEVMEAGVDVLIYAGDQDFICNWLGNKNLALNIPWKNKDAFNQQIDSDWNKNTGKLRTFDKLSFLQVFQAGHMVPTDQPKVSLDMVKWFFEKTKSSLHEEAQHEQDDNDATPIA